MDKPDDVRRAIFAIWACIGLSVAAALLDRLTDRMSVGEFALNLIIYGFMVMFPYKLSRARNATRYVYTVLAIGGLIFLIGAPATTVPLFSRISSYIQLPILAISVYWLFTPTSNKWFTSATAQDSSDGNQRRT